MHSPDESDHVFSRMEYEYYRHNDKSPSVNADNAGRDVVPEWVQKDPVAAFWVWMFIYHVPDSIVRLSGEQYADYGTSCLYARLFATEAAPANHQARIRVTRKWLQELIRLTGTENVSDFLYVVHFLWSYAEKVNPMTWLGFPGGYISNGHGRICKNIALTKNVTVLIFQNLKLQGSHVCS